MSINRIDFGVIAATSEVSTIKASEESRPMADQQNFQAQFKEEVGKERNSVQEKENVGQGELHSDANEKGSNEYMGDGGRQRRGNGNQGEDNPILERQLTTEQMEKIASNVLDRNGRPVDLRISSGFDLKI